MFDLSNIGSILGALLGFGLVIFLHELGHFLSAKRHGVHVEKFAIGFDFFDLALARWRVGETQYVLGAFPLGGYVKMMGFNETSYEVEAAQARHPRSFLAQSVPARIEIISAGVIANFLSAFVLFWLALVLGYRMPPTEIGEVGLQALQDGLRPGDVVEKVGKRRVEHWFDLVVRFALMPTGDEASFTVRRGDEVFEVRSDVQRPEGADFNLLGFRRAVEPVVGSLELETPADEAGVKPGDRLLAIDGEPIRTWQHFAWHVQRRRGQPAKLQVEREGESRTLDITFGERAAAWETSFEVPWTPVWDPVLTWVAPEGPAAKAGLQAGDRLLSIDGESVASWLEAWPRLRQDEDGRVQLDVQRGGQRLTVGSALQEPIGWGWDEFQVAERLGVASARPEELVVRSLTGRGEAGGLKPGDVVLSIAGSYPKENGSPKLVELDNPTWRDVQALLNVVKSDPDDGFPAHVTLRVRRGESTQELQLPLVEREQPLMLGFAGVGGHAKERLIQAGPIAALGPTLVGPFRVFEDVIMNIRAMAIGRVSLKSTSGPIGIFGATLHFASRGPGDLFWFLTMLSVNLAIVNFLPIPVTDGGHFVFLLYEKLQGRRMDPDLEARFQWAGLVLIMLLFVFTLFNDVSRCMG